MCVHETAWCNHKTGELIIIHWTPNETNVLQLLMDFYQIPAKHRNQRLWRISAITRSPMSTCPSRSKVFCKLRWHWSMDGWVHRRGWNNWAQLIAILSLIRQRSQDRSWRTCNAELKKHILKLTILREGKVSQVSTPHATSETMRANFISEELWTLEPNKDVTK